MTVPVQDPLTRLVYSGPGDYTFIFGIPKIYSLKVTIISAIGVTTHLNYGLDFSVSYDPTLQRGTVTTLAAPGPGTIIIERAISIVQAIDWVNNDDLDAVVLEQAFDFITYCLQQLNAVQDRSYALVQQSRGTWISGTIYGTGERVSYNGVVYFCVASHTSRSTFATDLADGLWIVFLDIIAAIQNLTIALGSSSTASTPAVDTNTTALATTAFVLNQLSSAAALIRSEEHTSELQSQR